MHSYYRVDLQNNKKTKYYEKFIKNKIGGSNIVGSKFKYHYEEHENRNGFFLGKSPHCVDVFVENENTILINNFSYFTNCSINQFFPRKNGTEDLMKTTLELIKNYYPNTKKVILTDTSTVNCGKDKFQLYQYMLLLHGITYYMRYGFIPENDFADIKNINKEIKNTIITKEIIYNFIENNNFRKNRNEDFRNVVDEIFNKKIRLRKLLEETKFIKDIGKGGCKYYFTFVNYVFNKYFWKYNFFMKSYVLHL